MYISYIECFDSVFSQVNFSNLTNIFKDNKYLNFMFFTTESKEQRLIQHIILNKLFFYLLTHLYLHLTLINPFFLFLKSESFFISATTDFKNTLVISDSFIQYLICYNCAENLLMRLTKCCI